MNKITLKYKDDSELKTLVTGISNFAKIIKISTPKRGDTWTKIYIDIDLKNSSKHWKYVVLEMFVWYNIDK